MADQTVHLTNIPDSGSPQRIAYELYVFLRKASKGQDGEAFAAMAERHLRLYEQCLSATKGERIDTSKLT